MTRRRNWTTAGLLACEYGDNFDSATYWTSYVTGGGAFERPTFFGSQTQGEGWRYFGFDNAAGAGKGARAYFLGSSPSNATTKAHSVSMRVQGTAGNISASAAWGLSPATCVHAPAAGTLGNCYFLNVYHVGPNTQTVDIKRQKDGVTDILTTFTAPITAGDYVTLSYEYVAAVAELEVYVNGFLVGSYSDSSVSRFDMAAVGGKPGMFGHNVPVSQPSVGAWTTEWWVTDGFSSIGELPPPYPSRAGSLFVVLRRHQRYTDDANDIRVMISSSELLSVAWGYSRIGGCNEAEISARFGAAGSNEVPPDTETFWIDPNATDWEANDWLGGLLEIHHRVDARSVPESSSELVWTGSLSSVEFDASTRELSIRGDGLMALLEKTFITAKYANITVRDAIIDILGKVTKTNSAPPNQRDNPIRFNASKIAGLSTVMDFVVLEKTFEWESAKTAIDDLLAFLPEGIVWGVDREGEFYVDFQTSPYTENLIMSVPTIFYDSGSALEWTREFRMDEIVNQFTALGQEPDDETVPRVTQQATCDKSREVYGLREQVETIDETEDQGILGKYAQAACKKAAVPEMSAKLRVQEPLQGGRTLRQSLSYISPPIAVLDRSSRVDLGLAGEHPQFDYAVRLMGDIDGSMPDLNGSGGAQVRFASIAPERLNKQWMVHIVLKFTTAHPGAIGEYAYIGGRNASTGPERGWGYVTWLQTTGDLFWCQDEAGAIVRYNLGVNVPSAAPANQVVNLTVYRDSAGRIKAWNGGGSPTSSSAPNTNVLSTAATDWTFWKPPTTGSGLVAWDGGIEQFWFFDTLGTGWFGVPIDSQPDGIDGANGFLARNNGRNLGRAEGSGCLMHCKFNEHYAAAVDAGVFRLWRGAGNGDVGFSDGATIVSIGSSPVDLQSVSTNTARGHIFGDNHRWGGPLILTAESINYTANPTAGTVVIDYDLVTHKAGLSRSLEAIREDVRRQNEALRRLRRDV